jgi:dTDP-glucose 4,6-dehydratase
MNEGGRYLITGGAGFIGSHLSETLLRRGCEVVVIDNFITGRPENIRSLLGNPRFRLIEQDIIRPLSLDGALAGIFHLASPASPVDYAAYPIETLHVGAIGSDNVLKLAQSKRCPVLVASTSEVYGDPLEHPQKETYWGNVNPVGPRGCYDESKRYLEALTMAYHRTFGLNTHIIRIFNTYGPRMRTDDGRVVPNFCMQAIQGGDITVYGDGSQTRSFCFVDDLVEGMLRVIACDYAEPINLGNPNELTILEFARAIARLAGSPGKIVHRPLPIDDPKVRKPDISLAKRLLAWEPKVGLATGLERTFAYFKSKSEQGDIPRS